MENTITAQEYAKALADGRVLIVGAKFTKNGWTAFKVYEMRSEGQGPGMLKLFPIIVPAASYWSEKMGAYRCGAWGTDRRLEVILSIGYSLGLNHSDMPQRYQWIQDTY